METAQRWKVLAVAMIGYGIVQSGLHSVNQIMPTISADLGIPLSQGSWLLTAYLLAMTSLILPAGRLGDQYGYRNVFLWGVGTFALFQTAVGLATSFWPLVILRVGQGVGSALISGTAMAWATNSFPASHRGRVVGAVTAASYLGSMSTALIATWAVERATWHWAFIPMIPICVIALLLGVTTPAPERAQAPRTPLDWAGVAVLAMALTAFSLGLNHVHGGAETWSDGVYWHLPMHILFVALLLLFVTVQRRVRNPIMPLAYFRSQPFVAALSSNLVLHTIMMGTLAVVPFLIQVGLGLTPSHTAGNSLMIQVLSMIMTPLSGWLYDRADSRILLPAGMLVVGGSIFVMGLFTTALSYPGVLGLSLLLGVGTGLFLTSNNAALMGSVPPEQRGFASGMIETTRQMGHGLGAAMIGLLLSGGISAGPDLVRAGFRNSYWAMAAIAALGVVTSIWYGRARGRRPSSAA